MWTLASPDSPIHWLPVNPAILWISTDETASVSALVTVDVVPAALSPVLMIVDDATGVQTTASVLPEALSPNFTCAVPGGTASRGCATAGSLCEQLTSAPTLTRAMARP